MPNWCQNEVTVIGDTQAEILEFKKYVTDGRYDFVFDAIIPMPENIKETTHNHLETNSHPNWYNWSIENWGTKWDADDVQSVDTDKTTIVYYFDTAWSPPEPICVALRTKFPHLIISWFYREDGIQISGWL